MRRILAQSHLDVTCQRKERLPKKGWGKSYVGQNKLILAVSVLMSLVKRQKKHLSNNGKKNDILDS